MQTSVNPAGQPAAIAGLESDNGHGDVISGFSEETVAEIRFGVAVQQGTAVKSAKLLGASTDKVKGVSAFGYMHAPGSFGDLGTVGVLPKGNLRVKRQGRLWVVIDQSIATIVPFSDRGFVRYAANGGNTILGAFSNVTDAGFNTDLTKIVEFTSPVVIAADGTKIAEVDIDFVVKP